MNWARLVHTSFGVILCRVGRQVAQLSQTDRAAGWVSFGRNTCINGRRYSALNIVGGSKLEALIFLHGIQLAAWLCCERVNSHQCCFLTLSAFQLRIKSSHFPFPSVGCSVLHVGRLSFLKMWTVRYIVGLRIFPYWKLIHFTVEIFKRLYHFSTHAYTILPPTNHEHTNV